MLGYVIFGITYGFAATVQPGPFLTYIISQTLSQRWRHTLPACFAPLLSDGPIIILVLFLLSQIPQWLVRFLHFGGALFLFYLAIGSYQSWKNFNDEMPAQVRNEKQTLLKATFVNILNPAPYLGWSLVMGPLFLKGYHESPINGIALLISFYITLILCLTGIIFLFAFSRRFGPRVNKILIGLSVIALIGFGVYQLWMGIIS